MQFHAMMNTSFTTSTLRAVLIAALTVIVAGCRHGEATPAPFDKAQAVVYEMNVRQLTPEGTFAAAERHLTTLKDMGVDIVWVMPPYPIGQKGRKGTLGSYYAVKDYCDINPEFGTLEDFDRFLDAAHALGMRVILDWVPNHTAPDHPWVTEKPADWYVRDSQGNTIVEYDWTDIAKLNYDCPEMRAEMVRCMRFWLERGVDGFRCDVAHQIPQDFWEPTIKELRRDYGEDLYMLAEGEDKYLDDSGFDATYAWRLHHLLNDIAQGNAGAGELSEYVAWNAAEYSPQALRLSFITNHDENSWAGTEFERMGEAWKACAVLCWTLPGSQPLIYTGQEIGWNKRFEFFEKDAIPELKTNSFTDFYAELDAIRHAHPALAAGRGSYEELPAEPGWFCFRRSLGDDVVTVSVQLQAPWAWRIESPADRVAHIEPPCWWTGMKTPLQLMVNGEGISEWDVSIEGGRGVKVTGVHKADSPNYLFVDVAIDKNAAPGSYNLVFTREGERFSVPYRIESRREGSAQRESFSTSDAIYLLMPDRYSDGDPSNNSVETLNEGLDMADYFGRHGGDIQGIEDHLDYIADLGFTALWCTPLLEDNEVVESYHGYACTDYYKIDARLGSNRKYREMVRLAHERGLKVIMDIVTNHSGIHHWWYGDLPFKDWIHTWPEYTHSNCSFSVQNDPYVSQHDKANMEGGWFDVAMADNNLDNPFLLQYFKQWAVWWIEWADLDGLRVDTYPYNEKEPMSRWCASLRSEYPRLNIVGECWTTNIAQAAYWQDGAGNKDGFNSNLPSIMDFCLHDALCRSINTDREDWENGLSLLYQSLAGDYYLADPANVMVFPGNHDTARLADVCRGDLGRIKMAMALMATVRGYPQIFGGDEIAQRSADLSQGHGGLRVMFDDGWADDPDAAALHDYMRALLRWRKGSKAVQEGRTLHFLSRDNTYAYFRYTPDEAVFVYLNNNPEPRQVPWEDYAEITATLKGEARDVLSGGTVDLTSLRAEPKSAVIVEFK